LSFGDHAFGGLVQLHFGGVVHGVAGLRLQVVLRSGDLEHVDVVERPAMRGGGGAQLLLGLRKSHEQAALALRHAVQQELQRQRGLSGAGIAFDEKKAIRNESPAEHVIQPRDPGRHAFSFRACRLPIDHSLLPTKLDNSVTGQGSDAMLRLWIGIRDSDARFAHQTA
jgi:hypothetical protein